MSQTTQRPVSEVPPEEVARRIAEWRRVAYEHRAPADVVYHPSHHPCPWPGCDVRIAGIQFDLEKLFEPARYEDAVKSWWRGLGLVARCPGCTRHVLFGLQEKRAVTDAALVDAFLLPDNWHQTAYVVQRPSE